jgi:hypothetical protein
MITTVGWVTWEVDLAASDKTCNSNSFCEHFNFIEPFSTSGPKNSVSLNAYVSNLWSCRVISCVVTSLEIAEAIRYSEACWGNMLLKLLQAPLEILPWCPQHGRLSLSTCWLIVFFLRECGKTPE